MVPKKGPGTETMFLSGKHVLIWYKGESLIHPVLNNIPVLIGGTVLVLMVACVLIWYQRRRSVLFWY
jgi:hypothetical protein